VGATPGNQNDRGVFVRVVKITRTVFLEKFAAAKVINGFYEAQEPSCRDSDWSTGFACVENI
jgi:hypothetical protein